jgi:hypothetical protein
MVHLVMHLPHEAIERGTIHYGSMYLVERRLGYLKSTVRNNSNPKGLIAEGYIVDECLTFCSRYLGDRIETRFNRANGNQDNRRKVALDDFGVFFPDGDKCVGQSK